MYCPTQLKLFNYPKGNSSFGGSHSKGQRKTARPVSVKEPMHVVLRAECAKGALSLLQPRNAKLLHGLMKKYSKRFDVRVYNFAIVGNHLHLITKAKSKRGFQNFLRTFAGQVAQKITGSKPGSGLKKRFWDLLAFSRVIAWGRAFTHAQRYVYKNIREGAMIRQISWLANTG